MKGMRKEMGSSLQQIADFERVEREKEKKIQYDHNSQLQILLSQLMVCYYVYVLIMLSVI
jgi:hypothetical protein